jgi:hypothetical protein
MKQYLLLFVLVITLSARAQITIQSTDMPTGGNTYLMSTGNPLLISDSDLQITGANQNWNFNLTAVSQAFDTAYSMSQVPTIFHIAFLSSDYADRLAPDINFGNIISITNNYDFYTLNSAKLEQTGTGSYISGLPFPTFFNPKDIIYELPINYGDVDSCNSYFSASVPTIGSWTEGRKRINHVDGWGNLQTPLGTKQVLRVRSEVFYNDTVTIDTPIHISLPPFPREQVEYKWLAKDGGFPMLEVVTTVTAGTETVTQILYQDTLNTTGIVNSPSSGNILIYPQPSNNNFIITLDNNKIINAISIYDICGRLVKKISEIDQPIINISTSDIPAGLYLVVLQSRDESYETKISVIH